MTDIVKINASDYGLEESKATEIKSMFTPMLDKMEELEVEYNEVIKEEITPGLIAKAKALRMKYVKVRTGTAEIHKELKAFYLKGGRFVDAFKNTQEFASGEKEKTLKAIEEHFENIEREKKEKLKTERIALIQPYVDDVNTYMLGEMSEDGFQKLLAGSKLQYEMRIEAERKAEEERIAREKAEAEERERIRQDNERLRKEVEEREKAAEVERKKQAAILKEQQDKAEAQRKAIEAEREKERQAAEAERKKLEEQARKDREERERLAAELKRKEDEERKAKEAEEKRRKAEEKKARLAPDKTKLLSFMQEINNLKRPEVTSIEAADIASKANIMLVQVSNYIKENSANL